MALTGRISQNGSLLAEVSDRYNIAVPRVSISLAGPDVADKGSFNLDVQIVNTGKIDENLLYSVVDSSGNVIDSNTLALPAGETRIFNYTRQIVQNTIYTVSLTGDVTQTASKTVLYGEAAGITAAASSVYPEGAVSVPVTITNTGSLDETLSVTYQLGQGAGVAGQETRSYFIPKGGSITDTVAYTLAKGNYQLIASSLLPAASISASFTVAKDPDVSMAMTAGSQGTTGLIPVMMNVVNNGYSPLNGTISVAVMNNFGKAAWRGEVLVSGLASQASQNYVVNVDSTGIIPGAYATTATLYSSSGQQLAVNQTQVRTLGPIFEITSLPANPSFTQGTQAALAFAIKNTGTLAGTANLSVQAANLLSQTVSNSLQPGEQKAYTFNFNVPEDELATAYSATYSLTSTASQGTSGQAPFNVAAVNFNVPPTLDKQVYNNGDTAVLNLSIAKQSDFQDGPFLAIISYGAYHDIQGFTSGAQPVSLTFNVPLTQITGNRLFYGVYFLSGNKINESSLHINTPPVVTVVSPAANSMFNAAFNISARVADGGLGIGTVEYKVDNNQWAPLPVIDPAQGLYSTAWTPPAADSGHHTVNFRATDKAGNTSIPVSVSFAIDTMPPVTTITPGTPKYTSGVGKLYVTSTTTFTLSATEDLSGVAKTEFSVDGGSYTTYAGPVNLDAYQDGTHTITYRSTDNLGNIEADKSLNVILDKTPPVTAISGSDPLTPGAASTVSPMTRFSLSAVDTLSGVKAMSYSVDGGAWEPYLEVFSLASLTAGQHVISYKSIDNVLNEEQVQSLTVRLVVIDVSKKIDTSLNVLIGAWRRHSECDDKDGNKDKDKNCKAANTDEDRQGKERSGKDSNETANRNVTIDRLEAILTSAGIAYYLPVNEHDFKASVRSGRYNTYLLVDCEEENLAAELREVVNYGDGLLFLKTRPDADSALNDVFGVKFMRKTTGQDLLIQLIDSPISNVGTLETSGKGVISAVTATTAQSLGFMPDNDDSKVGANKRDDGSYTDTYDVRKTVYPAIVYNQYGRGRAMVYLFDLLSSPDQDRAASLLINSLNYIRPSEHYARALDSVPVKITLNNSTEPMNVKMKESLPDKTTADWTTPESVRKDNTITWLKSLNSGEKATFGYYLNLPDLAGDYKADTIIMYSNGSDYRLIGEYGLTVTIQYDAASLLQEMLAELAGFTATNTHDAERLAEAIERLQSMDARSATQKNAKRNIQRIIEAAEKLQKLSVDTSAMRLKLGELLKIWEKKWYLAKRPGKPMREE